MATSAACQQAARFVPQFKAESKKAKPNVARLAAWYKQLRACNLQRFVSAELIDAMVDGRLSEADVERIIGQDIPEPIITLPGEEAISGIVRSIRSIPDFLALITQAQTWVRVGEVIGGGILLYLGLRYLGNELGFNVPSLPIPTPARLVKR